MVSLFDIVKSRCGTCRLHRLIRRKRKKEWASRRCSSCSALRTFPERNQKYEEATIIKKKQKCKWPFVRFFRFLCNSRLCRPLSGPNDVASTKISTMLQKILRMTRLPSGQCSCSQRYVDPVGFWNTVPRCARSIPLSFHERRFALENTFFYGLFSETEKNT